jgi:mannose-1-phosphate guanylyltransferase
VSAPRQAVVLCAGEGRRLAPLTNRCPKPLLPLLNVPLLAHALRRLARAGVRRVALNAWHLAPQLRTFAATAPEPGLELHLRVEPRLLGTGGALANLRDWIAPEPLLVLAGDIVADFDFAALAARHAATRAEATMALAPRADVQRFGAVEVDEAGLITDIVGTLQRPGLRACVNASAHVLEPAFLAHLPDGPSCLVRQGYLPALAAGARCAGWAHEGAWAELGTPAALLAAQRAALLGRLPVDPELLAAGGRRDGSHVLVHPTADVAPDAHLADGTVVGAGARVGPAARLAGCLLLPGAHVAGGAVLRDRILEPEALAAEAR